VRRPSANVTTETRLSHAYTRRDKPHRTSPLADAADGLPPEPLSANASHGGPPAQMDLPCCFLMMRNSSSGLNARMSPWTGHAAASPSAQIVCPSIW